jgi:hypothetical protein
MRAPNTATIARRNDQKNARTACHATAGPRARVLSGLSPRKRKAPPIRYGMKINQEDRTSSLNVTPPKAPAIADTRMIHTAAPILDLPWSSVDSSAAASSINSSSSMWTFRSSNHSVGSLNGMLHSSVGREGQAVAIGQSRHCLATADNDDGR